MSEEVTIGTCRLICGDARAVLPTLAPQTVALCVTSPPYDHLRAYGGHLFDFEGIAQGLVPTLAPGGVVVWVVGDATVHGSETGSSFRQALYFRDTLGLRLHDTMIYAKANPGGARGSIYGYWQAFEYMFVFANGAPRVFHPLADRPNAKGIHLRRGGGRRNVDGTATPNKPLHLTARGRRTNIWTYPRGDGAGHPAVFPEGLAWDHVQSWSDPGDLVLDPCAGAFTVGVACVRAGRPFVGIEIHRPYWDQGCQRIEAAYAQMPLFATIP